MSFQEAARGLMTAALLARVPASVVREYLVLAQAAAWLSQDSWRENPDEDWGGGSINGEFANIVRDHSHLLADVIWAPTPLRKIFSSRQSKKLSVRTQKLDNTSTQKELARSREYGVA
ncbi:hypothetical protein [Dietzia sp. CQ4]|uniref:hypothetical protein n=1 Tax=Dietzia sp. (strain CQ4) TaxID=370437 RepID=UPI0015FBD9E4|nr:hypothetical protein [Dietzia sp. CQ4]